VLVIMATFAAYVVTFTTSAQATTAVAVQGVRAHAAARAGLQWAAYTLRDPQFTAAPGHTPRDCFASPTTLALPAEFAGFAVQVSCTRFPALGATPNFNEEGTQRLAQYLVTATASSGTPGSLDYVERQLEARIEVCKDPSSAGPGYICH
jgi:MSHA biogenesis protein MshP